MSKRLLIVEDDAMSRLLLEKQTAKLGLFDPIIGVASGQEALDHLKDNPTDLVIMDINLPGQIDGIETAIEIDKRYRIPLLFISVHKDQGTISRALQTEAYSYLTKPYNTHDLSVAINTAIIKGDLYRKLRENEAKLSSIVSTIQTAVITTKEAGEITFINPAASELIGKSLQEVKGQKIEDVLTFRDINSLATIFPFKDLLTGQNSKDKQTLLLDVSPNLNLLVQISISTLERGWEKEHCFFLHDVTAEHEAARRLSMLATAMESNSDAVVISGLSATGEPVIQYVNESFTRITGWSKSEAIGQPIDMLSGRKTSDRFLPAILFAIRENKRFRKDGELYREDGNTFLAEWSLQPIEGENASEINHLHMIRDVTQIRRMEESLRQSQKLEAVGRLAGGIAHDFNNILSVINSFVDLIELKMEADDPLQRYVNQVRIAGQRGADLVARLMQFSRGDEPQLRILNPGEVLHDIEPLLRQAVPENIEFIISGSPNLSSIRIDIGQLEQVLVNLSVNARDAINEAGRVQLRAKDYVFEKDDAEIPAGKYVLIEVEDDGCGIPESDLPHIFDPFFTTKPTGKGTGLGLATVFSIVRQCEGYIRVHSIVGRGTTFRIYFPALPDVTEPQKDSESILGHEKGHGETILIVEDDSTFAECISGLLSLQGYRTLIASDGMEAVTNFLPQAKNIHLILSDIVMPNMSGREMAQLFLDDNPALKTIFMTGYDDRTEKEVESDTSTILLKKPFSLDTILHTVKITLSENKTENDQEKK